MGALNYIAMVVFAVIFIGVSFTLYSEFQRGAAEREFEARVELLSERVKALTAQGTGSTDFFEIYVPPNSELSFSDSMIVARIGSNLKNFPVNLPISGPTFSDRKLNLVIQRTDDGVNVDVG